VPAPLPERAGSPGRRETADGRYVPYAGLTAGPPTLVTGRARRNEVRRVTKVSLNAILVRPIPARSDGAVNLLGLTFRPVYTERWLSSRDVIACGRISGAGRGRRLVHLPAPAGHRVQVMLDDPRGHLRDLHLLMGGSYPQVRGAGQAGHLGRQQRDELTLQRDQRIAGSIQRSGGHRPPSSRHPTRTQGNTLSRPLDITDRQAGYALRRRRRDLNAYLLGEDLSALLANAPYRPPRR